MSTDRVRAPGQSGYALPPSVALTAQLRGEIPEAGVPVALVASFTGLRGVPVVALARNSAAPRLRLFGDRAEVRVLRRASRRYADIERVELSALRRGAAGSPRRAVLEFRWKGRLTTFVASFAHPGCGRVVLAFLDRHGVPLGPAARAHLDTLPEPAERGAVAAAPSGASGAASSPVAGA